MEATQETKRRRRGEVREDGMVFWQLRKAKNKEYWVTKEKYQDLITKEKLRIQRVESQFPGRIHESRKRWVERNREKNKECKRRWFENNPDYLKKYSAEYCRRKRSEDPSFRMSRLLRDRLRRAFQGRKSKKTTILLGTQTLEVKQHIARLFLPGMTWENMGKDGWHIDHIIPLACAKSLKHLEALCHYLNLQPLWAKENLSKGDKIPETIPDNIKHLLPENWNE